MTSKIHFDFLKFAPFVTQRESQHASIDDFGDLCMNAAQAVASRMALPCQCISSTMRYGGFCQRWLSALWIKPPTLVFSPECVGLWARRGRSVLNQAMDIPTRHDSIGPTGA